ncbi:MAG: NADH-quinone oxidoreductase subunit C, partial [Sciscionella sp.]
MSAIASMRRSAGGEEGLRSELVRRVAAGERFAGLHGSGDPAHGLTITAMLAGAHAVHLLDAQLPTGATNYRALTPHIPAAFWYERVLHDLFGVVPLGHPRLDPLVLPRRENSTELPMPGAAHHPRAVEPDEGAWPRRVLGDGVFTIPHGPVRSGIFESVEYLVETPGEDIPHVNVRPFAKHRGAQVRFEGLSFADGVLLAERVEGIASVAHALAFAHAVETGCGVTVPRAAGLVRVIHAELERIANHLDVAMKLADAAGLAVAVARFGWHKERTLGLRARLCGSRFGRGVVVAGGVAAMPRISGAQCRAELHKLAKAIHADEKALMDSSSFLDRLRGTGPLDPGLAERFGALGPVGRASGCQDDSRWVRPYDAYPVLDVPAGKVAEDGDAMARLRVRWAELRASVSLIYQSIEMLEVTDSESLAVPVEPGEFRSVGWAEAPQGEVL